jgi:alginate O-acetyltransferase complex protein AlgI
MVFSSSVFLFIFLPFTLLGYYLLKENYRNAFLLLASLAFYAWSGPKYLILLLVSIFINYIFGLINFYIRSRSNLLRKTMLFLGIAANLAMLIYFKYFNFFVSTVNRLCKTSFTLQEITLPLGISFFTFCGISYIVDVYKGKVTAQKNALDIALYLSFFPKLAQGPITRYGDMAGQLETRTCTVEKFSEGVWRFTIGLAKKMVIANQLGIMVDKIYAIPAENNTAAVAWLASIGYTFQIYFDFCGYSDMAVGLGKMFGFDIMENFNYPYISKTMTEFWRRWHISLSTWFRDYLYIPLGGNRTGNVYVNLFIVFAVTGLWHGAAWNFVVWGLFHGVFILADHFMKNKHIEIKLPNAVKVFITFFVVNIGWVLFRAPGLAYAMKMFGVMFGVIQTNANGVLLSWYLSPKIIFIFILAWIASINWKELVPEFTKTIEGTYAQIILKDVVIVVLLAISIMLVMTSTYNAFIYFQF